MKGKIFIVCVSVAFLLASCGDSDTEKQSSEDIEKREVKIAKEVEEASEKAKEVAEETEKEVDKLLEDI